jgi:hypothetical protein
MRIDWLGNRGFRALRTSAGAHALVEAEAQKVLARAQSGVRNARDNTLVRALHG